MYGGRRKIYFGAWRLARILFAAGGLVAAASAACAPAPEIPAPIPVASDPNAIPDAGTVPLDFAKIQWLPGKPITAGSDVFIVEVMDGSGTQLISFILGGSEALRNSAVIDLTTGDLSALRYSAHSMRVVCGGAYQWHVLQMEGLNRSPWSAAWTFRIASVLHAAPTLVGPGDMAEIGGGRLSWNLLAGEGDLRYAYRIAESPDSGLPGLFGVFPNQSEPLEYQNYFTLQNGHMYYWQVQASRSLGCAGPWSAPLRFIWVGQNITGVTGSGAELPNNSSLAPPAPICVDPDPRNCPSESGTIPAHTPTPFPTLAFTSTRTIVIPTNTPQPVVQPTTAPTAIPACMDYAKNPDKCNAAGCYYWSDGSCSAQPEPPPPPSCKDYSTKDECVKNQCTWDANNNSCY